MPTIGFVGIDNAGKTTIIDVFAKQRFEHTIPTVGINFEQISFSEIALDFDILDMGGQKNFRMLWVDYLNTVDIVIYVIDASDHKRLEEALEEFRRMLVITEENNVPILILVNKIDLPNTMSAWEIGQRLSSIEELADRDWNIIETSAVTAKGLVEMIKWAYSKLTNNILDLEIKYREIADKKYYHPCPLLLTLPDGNYCINHDNFTPVKVVPLDNLFTNEMEETEEVIIDTIEEFKELGRMVCFNNIFVTDNDEKIRCATDQTVIEVEGTTANKDEYIDSYNMMHLTGGQMCSECIYKILFSAIKRKVKAIAKEYKKEELEEIYQSDLEKISDTSKCD